MGRTATYIIGTYLYAFPVRIRSMMVIAAMTEKSERNAIAWRRSIESVPVSDGRKKATEISTIRQY
jgi:hypothetical protein